MTTGASDSPDTKQSTAVDAVIPPRHLAISKQTLIIAVALLVVLSLVIFRLNAHANSEDGLEVQSTTTSSTGDSEPDATPSVIASTPDSTNTTEILPEDSTNSGSVQVNLNSSTTTSSDTSQNSSSTSVTVNGQPVTVKNGRVSKRFSSSDGSMRVQIQSSNQVSNGGD